MFTKILVANRGEIACRVIKTARRMGIEAVAVYSTADQDSLHVQLADEAYHIGPPPAASSYLNIDAIIAAAMASKAQAIHPGYGFLSENPRFAKACQDANIVFIGPSIQAMEAMASKQNAKKILEKSSVPLTPGYHGNEQSDERLLLEAKTLGFPVLLKAAAGGGGKGMRAVYEEQEFSPALAGARREAKASFADDTMIIEKLIQNPRHVEMQIMADNHGNIVHLFERDCSIQRRHQKVIEEAPAPNLSRTVREGLAQAAVTVASTIEYRGAGTIEFLVSGNEHYYFMEMNTRLQVEHPVTEVITGLDLVEWQLRIAANELLPLNQEEIHKKGHALECRIYAEDPTNEFIPSIGQINFLKEPTGEGIRIDTGIRAGSSISMYYDPMIAKLIAWGSDRKEALQRLQQALKHYHLGGVKTNIAFLQEILNHPKFISTQLSTDFLTQETIEYVTADKNRLICMAACVDYFLLLPSGADRQEIEAFSWQMHLQSQWKVHYLLEGTQFTVTVIPKNPHELTVKFKEETLQFRGRLTDNQLYLQDETQSRHVWLENFADHIIFYTDTGPYTVERFNWQHLSMPSGNKEAQLTAPMPATVVAILKNIGDTIKAGEPIIVLEAMKMEHTIHAPRDGVLTEIFYEIGSQVSEGAELIALESEELNNKGLS